LFSGVSLRCVGIVCFYVIHLAWHIGQDHVRSAGNLLQGLNQLGVFEFVQSAPKLPVLLKRFIRQQCQGCDHVAR
jgi:hypothetical protein